MACQNLTASTVRLITIGPGDAFWSAFGHTALAIDDVVYGFGYFSFDDDIVKSFLDNQMQYDLGLSDLNYEAQLARQQNRTFSVVELTLSTAEVKQLTDYLKWHNLPENQSYRYDYFLNNCATKIRDLLNLAPPDALQKVSQDSARASYIKQTFPAKHQGLMNLGLAVGYGWPAYVDRNDWELMAFPVFLEQHVIEHGIPAASGPPQVLFQSASSSPVVSFLLTHWALLSYVMLWTLLLYWSYSRSMAAKTLMVGHSIIGLILLGLWLLTPHFVADNNFNILLFIPLGFLLLKWPSLKWLIHASLLMWLLCSLWLGAWYLIPVMLPVLMAVRALTDVNGTQIKT